ncbi:MAG: hypothetical protein KF860_16810 [Cyclobacteriaceae bacterium]|nr:hypothetical protein [Cyclobacteriaceae bacterium]
MNKHIQLGFIAFFLLILQIGAVAQNSVGIGTSTPNPHAVLELVSPGNNQGFLAPGLTTSQRTTLASSLSANDNGLLVYDTSDNKFYYWQDAQWLPIKSGSDLVAGNGLEINGNTIEVIPDGDGDPTNEIQDLNLSGSTLTLTNNPSATPINLSAFTGTNSDDQTLTYNSSTGQLTISRLSGNQSQTITTAGSASGDLTGSYPSPTIANNAVTTGKINNAAVTSAKMDASGVTAGTYGSSTQTSQVTVNAQGRVTSAANVTISGVAPAGAASGDLTGSYPNPTLATTSGNSSVAAINNAATTSTINTNRLNATVVLDTEAPAAADIGGTFGTGLSINANAINSAKIADGSIVNADINGSAAVAVSKLAAGANTYVLTTTGGVPTWQAPIDNSAINEIQNLALGTPSGVNRTINISGGTGVTFSVADNDNSSSNEIQGLKDVLSTSNDANGLAAVNLSAITINDTATPGSLNVMGSHYMSYTKLPAGQEIYDVKNDEYIIYGRSTTSKPYNINLPSAGVSKGRVLIIRATGTSTSDGLQVNAADGIDGNGSTGILYGGEANIVYAITVFCDGKEWWTISKSKY